MRHLRPRLLVLAAVCALNSCGSSPPTRYFKLTSFAAGSPLEGPAATVPLRLDPVSIPAELDRQQLVRAGPVNRVEIDDQQRWAAPLEEQIRQVLSDDLRYRLPTGSVADPHEPVTDEPRRILSVSITTFDVDAQCAVRLDSDWSLRTSEQSPRHGSEQLRVGGSGHCGDDTATAMSRALAELASTLAMRLTASTIYPTP